MLKSPFFIAAAVLVWCLAISLGIRSWMQPTAEASKTEAAKAAAREQTRQTEITTQADLEKTRLRHAHEIAMANQRLQESILTRGNDDVNMMAVRLCIWVLLLLGLIFGFYLHLRDLREEIREVRKVASREHREPLALCISYRDLQQAGYIPEKTAGQDLHIISLSTSERRA